MPEPIYWITVEPKTINQGESATLEYFAENVLEGWLDGVGKAPAKGKEQVSPTTTRTYTFKVKVPGGIWKEAKATLTVIPKPQDIYIDPRAYWIKAQSGRVYKVKAVYFYDDVPIVNGVHVPKEFTESNKSCRITVKVVDKNGVGLPFENVIHTWPVNEVAAWKTDANGTAWFDLFDGSNFDPKEKSGPDNVLVGDAMVSGMGLPLKTHVAHVVIIEKQ